MKKQENNLAFLELKWTSAAASLTAGLLEYGLHCRDILHYC